MQPPLGQLAITCRRPFVVTRGIAVAVHWCLALLTTAPLAQIVTDGTVGPRATLNGPDLTIGAELGAVRGNNLFHSFQTFNIRTGETATFTGPERIANVIGRVTGGEVSRIDGTLRSQVGQADVYLVNPSGIMLGPNARVDVPAALHLGTADEIRFGDGSRYRARDPQASTLTVAAPESFGFLTPQPAALTIAGSRLEVGAGQTLHLAGGDIGIVDADGQEARLSAPGGSLRVEAVSGGMQMDGATLAADSARPGSDAGQVTVAVSGTLELRREAVISSDASGTGDAGSIRIDAGALRIHGDGAPGPTGIWSDALDGPGQRLGQVILKIAGPIEVGAGGWIASDTYGTGAAGSVSIQAETLRIDGGGQLDLFTGISSTAVEDAEGRAGRLELQIAGLLELRAGAEILSATWSPQDAGDIVIQAGQLRIDGAGSARPTGIASSAEGGHGNAGSVRLEIQGALELLNEAQITTSTRSDGDAGAIRIRAERLFMSGSTTAIVSGAREQATGQVGNIELQANAIAMRDGAYIAIQGRQTALSTAARSVLPGIRIRAGTLDLDHATIGASSLGPAPAAALWIQADDARLVNDTWITTAARQSDAGPIAIGGGILYLQDSLITTSANGTVGNGGDILLDPRYLILDGGFIQANALAPGARGGDIRIASEVLLASRGQVEIGGAARQEFMPGSGRNIIQAAAPGGERGTIQVMAPEFDLSAMLAPLSAPLADPDALLRDACQSLREGHPSRLIERLGGPVPPGADAPAGVAFDRERLERMLAD